MSWQIPDTLTFERLQERLKPVIENESEKKKAFGSALGQGKQAFDAACLVCGDKTSEALYISQNWLNDPEVLAAKDVYLKAVNNSKDLLDADELAAKLLTMVEEKTSNNMFYVLEGKDRLKCLELYAKVRGYDKSTPPSIQNTFNKMVVKFVAPENKQEQVIENNNDQISNNKSPIKLKLVS